MFLANKITKPIREITTSAKKIGERKYDIKFPKNGILEIDSLSETLEDVQKELSKNDELKRDLMANVSHDLKTPLTTALRENQFKLVMEPKAQYIVEFCYTPVPKAKFGGASYDIKNFTATVSNVETGESVLTISIKDVKKEAEVTDALVKAMKSVFSK